MSSLDSDVGSFLFVYGYDGTGKTNLWRALVSTIHARGDIVLAVASSRIAVKLLPLGRTSHSRITIPIIVTEDSVCNICQSSHLAELIRMTRLIIWDEAPMVQRFCVEAFDCLLRDVMHSNEVFGAKCVLMGGDFRQLLLVIPKGNRATIVDSYINSLHLWDSCKALHLTQNMRLSSSPAEDKERLEKFSRWLLDVGDGKLGLPHDGVAKVGIPEELLIQGFDDPMSAIVSSTYPNLFENLSNSSYFNDRAILAPTIECINQVNDFICSMLPGDLVDYFSCNNICKSS